MDGVLVDFVGGICAVHNRPSPYDNPANRYEWDIHKLWGISEAEFWHPTNYQGFWENLNPTPEAHEIVAACEAIPQMRTAILTSPNQNPHCVAEKKLWIKKHFPQLSKRMIFTANKEYCASADTMLIDDKTLNCLNFMEFGGHAMLYPRPWNSSTANLSVALKEFITDQDLLRFLEANPTAVRHSVNKYGKPSWQWNAGSLYADAYSLRSALMSVRRLHQATADQAGD